jgi:hypothetical protein
MIVVSAGRRIDASDAQEERFPLRNAEKVAAALASRLKDLRPSALVCAAACGSDLILLREAQSLGIRSRIVLPFSAQRFRGTSVTDRPGNASWDWGAIFDEVTQAASESDDLIVLPDSEGDEKEAYVAANHRIISEALDLSHNPAGPHEGHVEELLALIVWEGSSRGEDDVTGQLMKKAGEAGMIVEQVRTI